MVNSAVLISAVVFLIILAGLFSGAETGLYRLSRLRLRLGVEKKRLSFIILGKCLRDSSGLLLSMLICTNLAYYLTTSIVTYVFLKAGTEHSAELFALLCFKICGWRFFRNRRAPDFIDGGWNRP